MRPSTNGVPVRYVIAGYGISLATLAAYAAWMLRRARGLDRRTRP